MPFEPQIKRSDEKSKISIHYEIQLESYCKASLAFLDGTCTKEQFDKERKHVTSALRGVCADSHWSDIKTALASCCDNSKETERLLCQYLQPKLGEERGVSASLRCLNWSFCELLKNSIDAIVKNYLEAQGGNTLLSISVSIELDENENLILRVSDNAGGFPADYIDKTNRSISDSTYKTDHSASEKTNKEWSFGGNGIGLQQLITYFLDGELIDKAGLARKVFSVTPGEHSLEFSNVEILDGAEKILGAEIKFTSPLKPAALERPLNKECVPGGVASAEGGSTSNDDPVPLLSASPTTFLSARRRKGTFSPVSAGGESPYPGSVSPMSCSGTPTSAIVFSADGMKPC